MPGSQRKKAKHTLDCDGFSFLASIIPGKFEVQVLQSRRDKDLQMKQIFEG
jgi:hypothetical protein